MEQNNFEKNVQQKLGELKVPPSDSVWTNVEKQIGKKDKDRTVVFIFFFFILFLLCGGYWLLNSSKNSGQQKHQLSEVKKDSKPTNNNNSSLQKSESIINHQAKTPDSTTVSKEKMKTASIKIQTKAEVSKQKLQGSTIEAAERKQIIFLSNNENQRKENENKLSIEVNRNPIIGDNETVVQKETNIKRTDSVLDKKEIAEDSSENNGQAIAKKEQKKSTEKRKNRWKFGITFSGGTSMISKTPIRNSAFFVSDPGMYNGGIPSYYYTPSEIRNSTGFIAGIFAEKNISGKKKISIGISYKHSSLLSEVGNKIDTSFYSLPQAFTSFNNVYSSAVNLKTYRNNFHFIEVPISIKFPLNNNSKLPIFWNAGINISQLVATNALQFNSSAGLYYSDNSFFNKTQFGLTTGFSATLFAKGKRPFKLEPYFYYSTVSLANKGLYAAKHFTSIGLKTEILFHQK